MQNFVFIKNSGVDLVKNYFSLSQLGAELVCSPLIMKTGVDLVKNIYRLVKSEAEPYKIMSLLIKTGVDLVKNYLSISKIRSWTL